MYALPILFQPAQFLPVTQFVFFTFTIFGILKPFDRLHNEVSQDNDEKESELRVQHLWQIGEKLSGKAVGFLAIDLSLDFNFRKSLSLTIFDPKLIGLQYI